MLPAVGFRFTSMRFHLLWMSVPLIAVLLASTWSAKYYPSPPIAAIPLRKSVEAPPMCPWREPARDLRTFFEQPASYQTDTVILSDQLVALKNRLGRWPTPEENPLYVHRVFRGKHPIGSVLARRVKGEFGAIEIVLAVNENDVVRGVRLQRLREPQSVATILSSPRWLSSFTGLNSRSQWRTKLLLREVPSAARHSARAIIEGVRSSLILLEATHTKVLQSTLDGTTTKHDTTGH